MNGKKGFTLVECAVAIALVGIITLAAFSTVVYVAKSQDKYDRYNLALNKLECLLTCFKSGDFESAAELLTGCPVPEDKIFYYIESGVISTEKNYSWCIEVTIDGCSFTAIIYDNGGDVIYEMPAAYIMGN